MTQGRCTRCSQTRDLTLRVCTACRVLCGQCAACIDQGCSNCDGEELVLISEARGTGGYIAWADRGAPAEPPRPPGVGGQEEAAAAASDSSLRRLTPRAAALYEERRKLAVVHNYPGTKINAFRKRYGIREGREGGYRGEHIVRRALYRVTDVVRLRPPAFPPVPRQVARNRGAAVGTAQPARTIGFLATVPCPVKFEDVAGHDRHPVQLAQMYVDQYETSREAWDRLRVLLAINLRDDWRHLDDRTASAAAFLKLYTDEINAEFRRRELPAAAIGILWGPVVVKPSNPRARATAIDVTRLPVTELHVAAVDRIALSTDALREKLADVEEGHLLNKPLGQAFPFASFRAALVASPEATAMIADLHRSNAAVYIHTGDADLLDLRPLGPPAAEAVVANTYLFPLAASRIDYSVRELGQPPYRAGGAFKFTSEDIFDNLRAIDRGRCIDIQRSVLLTHLAKALDSLARGILGSNLDGAAYFAEPNSFLRSDLARGAGVRLAEITNGEVGTMPDWSIEVSRRIAAAGGPELILTGLSFLLGTSSRHALVVVTDDASVVDRRHHVRIGTRATPVEILIALRGEHNTQISETQLNERFRERGGDRPGGPLRTWFPRPDLYDPEDEHPRCTHPGWIARTIWGLARDADAINTSVGRGELVDISARDLLPPADGAATFDALVELLEYAPSHADTWSMCFGDWSARDGLLKRGLLRTRHGDGTQLDLYPIFKTLLEIELVYAWGLVMAHRILTLPPPKQAKRK